MSHSTHQSASTTPIILDELTQIKLLDQGKMLLSLESLADQFEQTWAAIQKLSFTPTAPIHHIVVSGLGGSALGADIARSLFKSSLKLPIEISRDYTLPNYINENTLVILASYSGTTEETISALQDVATHHPQIMAIATGGAVIDYAREHHHTYYQIQPDYNPGGQARTALGYSILGTLGLLQLAGALTLTETQIKEIIVTLLDQEKRYHQAQPTTDNPAKLLALQLVDRRPILIGADFLEGALHTAANALNENSKCLADYKIVPEMNHHWLEGLSYPLSNRQDSFFLLIRSQFNHPRNQQRLDLNAELFTQLDFDHLELNLETDSPLTQVFELISLLSYTSFYLAMLMGLDPSPTPNVNWLKKELGQWPTKF